MRGHLVDGERDLLGAAGLAERVVVPLVDRDATAQVRQLECLLAIAAVCRSDESEERVVLSEMGRVWPSQNIQPLGGKFPANILISPI
jgi:hypothetical protein